MYKQKMNKELKDYLYMLVGSILTPDDYRKILDYFNQLKQERDHYKNKTLRNLYMKDFGGEKVFCLENDKETFRDMVFDLQERIDKAIEYIEQEKTRLAKEVSNIYEDTLDRTRLVNEDIYNELDEVLDILKGSDNNE